jgi:type I restriction enzyme S subunit
MRKIDDSAKGWKHAPLSELMEFATGGVWGDPPEKANGVDSIEAACIRGTDFRDWDVRKASAAVSRAIDAKSLEKRKLQVDDILVEVSGGGPEQPVGRTVHIDQEAIESSEGRPMVPTNFLRLLRLRSGVDAAYVNYYLKYFYVTGNISDYQGGSNNLRNLRFKDYITIDIPLAPFPQQRRIVSAIELQLGRLDAAVARLHAAKAKLKRYKQAVLKAAVSGELTGGDPSSWEEHTFREVCDVTDYVANGSFASIKANVQYSYEPEFAVLVRFTDSAKKWNGNYVYVNEASFKFLRKSELVPGDIVISNVGEPGKVFTVPDLGQPMTLGPNSVRVRPIDKRLSKAYLALYFQSQHGQDELASIITGTTQRKFNKTGLRETLVSFPQLPEQLKIITAVAEAWKRCADLQTTLDAKLVQSTRLRQAVLKRAFEGRLG